MKTSAGLLLYRRRRGKLEVLLAHPGGPFWQARDEGAWSIPKGEVGEDEDPEAAALREFAEETGHAVAGHLTPLGFVKQKSGKIVMAWAVEGDLDPDAVVSNTFAAEWPPGSGVMREFPEIDRADWFGIAEARRRVNPAQVALLDRLVELVD